MVFAVDELSLNSCAHMALSCSTMMQFTDACCGLHPVVGPCSVQPSNVRVACGSPLAPRRSSRDQKTSGVSLPIKSDICLTSISGRSIPCKCCHLLVSPALGMLSGEIESLGTAHALGIFTLLFPSSDVTVMGTSFELISDVPLTVFITNCLLMPVTLSFQPNCFQSRRQ